MYGGYCEYLNSNKHGLATIKFKSDRQYMTVLEHVTPELGQQYLDLITTEFSTVDFKSIISYVMRNDKYGGTVAHEFYFNGKRFVSSPTTLRYIYHALMILKHYESGTCKNIVEVGCGYGGLFLAIDYFSNLHNICIEKYHIVDMQEPLTLISAYLQLHEHTTSINMTTHDASTYGANIVDNDLFFISNYCYTEISTLHNQKYSEILIPKITNGFIVWQNGGNQNAYPIEKCEDVLNRKIDRFEEERPQTDAGHGIYKNFFVFI